MNTEEYQVIQTKIQKAVSVWRRKGHQQKNLVDSKSYSESTLSKILGGKEKVGEDTLANVLAFVEDKLNAIGYQYDDNFSEYILDEDALEIQNKTQREGIFSKMAGLYEMYHLAAEGGIILKNILQIYPDGNVLIMGKENNTYYGKAHNFLNNLVCINIHRANHYDFFHQIIFDIGNYLMYGGEQVQRIFGISTTISLENMPMANLRVLIRLPQEMRSQPFQYVPYSAEWQELNAQYPNLIAYLTENATLKLKKRINDLI